MAELFTINKPQGEIIDIDLTPVAKKAIRINGDNDRILYLNTSDMSIGSRLENAYPQLQSILEDIQKSAKDTTIVESTEDGDLNVDETLASTHSITVAIQDADLKMRALMDYIFDANVSEICAPDGTMYDMFNGTFRFEYIIETLIKLYTDNLDREYRKLKLEVGKHTNKYKKG